MSARLETSMSPNSIHNFGTHGFSNTEIAKNETKSLSKNSLGKEHKNYGAGSPQAATEKTVYITRTNFEVVGGKRISDADLTTKVRRAISDVHPSDTLAVEGLSTFGTNERLLRTFAKELSALPSDRRPKLEVFISGMLPAASSDYAAALTDIKGAFISRDHIESGVKVSVPNYADPAVIKVLKNKTQEIINIARDQGTAVDVVSFDDHFGSPSKLLGETVKANSKNPKIRSASDMPKVMTESFGALQSGFREQGIQVKISVNGTNADAIKNHFTDPLSIGQSGFASQIEFQIYRDKQSNFSTSLDNLLQQIRARGPENLQNISQINVAIAPNPNEKAIGRRLTPSELANQRTRFEAFTKEVQAIAPHIKVRLSLFPYQGFYNQK